MPNWIRYTLFAIVMLCCMVIGMRVYVETAQRAQTAQPTEVHATDTAPTTLPPFTLNDIDGVPRAISEWQGQPLLINFWATWCAPCRREIPLLQMLHRDKAAAGIQVVGVAIDRQSDVETFIGEYGVSYPNLVGEADALAVSDLFGLDGLGLPFSVLSAADGQILTIHVGEIDTAQLRTLVAVSQEYAAGTLDLAAARDKLAAL